ncbi:HAMP domain-containing sensor histidine kinase [Paenibacillus filicis]|uniref:histidine kinase n=1 Tax=Paenibacillus filicis TaxID=669464 RepID=A0ABU9DP53_9BACL
MRVGQWPMAVKLWGVFAALTLCIFVLLAVLLPWLLKGFFTDQLYDILADSQVGVHLEYRQTPVEPGVLATMGNLLHKQTEAAVGAVNPRYAYPLISTTQTVGPVTPWAETAVARATATIGQAGELPAERMLIQMAPVMPRSGLGADGQVVRHFVIGRNQAPADTREMAATLQRIDMPATPGIALQLSPGALPAQAIATIEQNAYNQTQRLEKYKLDVNNESMLYVIRKELLGGQPNYIVSYASSHYRNDLVTAMFWRLMLLLVGLLVVSWLPCMALAKYLTRPLVQMEQHVGRLAQRDWHEPLETGSRRDEIGRLAKAIEAMRQRLVRQDKSQQFFLQHISHELKTPVMVIRSYAQSILDGVFPKGSLAGSLGVIMKESERLEKRIRDLLILNKLNYFSTREKPHEPFDVKSVVDDTIERLKYRRPEIEWELDLEADAELRGDREQWGIAFENLLDNQLRYAQSCIRVSVTAGSPPAIRVANDGPPLEESELEGLFEPFRTGGSGQFGLGLAIVRQIAGNHGMNVRAVNEDGGVAFYMEAGTETQVPEERAS